MGVIITNYLTSIQYSGMSKVYIQSVSVCSKVINWMTGLENELQIDLWK